MVHIHFLDWEVVFLAQPNFIDANALLEQHLKEILFLLKIVVAHLVCMI
jgi:hypothetical protein